MLLTDSEIMDINQNAEFDSAIGYARKIESAVLEKLKAQSDVGVVVDNGTRGTTTIRRNDGIGMIAYGARLYEHPLPPDDVVRDAERYKWISVADRLPDPKVSVLVAREGRRLAEKTCHTGKEWLLESNHFPVTHWMILPMTPQTRSVWEQMHAGIKNAAIDAAMKGGKA